MQWCETVIHTATEGAELVSELLVRNGAVGTEIIDRADVPDPNKPGVYWELYDPKLLDDMPADVLVKGWFEIGAGLNDIMSSVRGELKALPALACGLELGSLEMDIKDVADEDWSENWKKNYKPFRVGSRLVVKPTWESYEPKPGDLMIELDPGMAFGTGTHETTNMCMRMVEKHYKDGMRVMDVGTGSGILAIAAARLGAKDVLAIDIDPDAVKTALENVKLNKVEDAVRVAQGDLVKSEAMPCELAVANIVADAICMLSAPLTRHLVQDGLFICSGIIRERENDVLEAAKAAGYTLIDRMAEGEWVALAYMNGAR